MIARLTTSGTAMPAPIAAGMLGDRASECASATADCVRVVASVTAGGDGCTETGDIATGAGVGETGTGVTVPTVTPLHMLVQLAGVYCVKPAQPAAQHAHHSGDATPDASLH